METLYGTATLPGTPSTLQSVRMAREFSRVEFLRTLRAVTGQDVKLRTLRGWECKEFVVPAWAIEAYRVVLNLSDAEVVAVVRWAASSPTASPSSSPSASESCRG